MAAVGDTTGVKINGCERVAKTATAIYRCIEAPPTVLADSTGASMWTRIEAQMDHIDPRTLKQAIALDEGAADASASGADAAMRFADVGGTARGVVGSRRTATAAGGSLRVEQLRLFALPMPVWASMLPEAARESLAVTGAPSAARRRVHRSRTAGRQRNVEEVERTLATYVPASVRGEAPSVVAEVMPVVQEWVAAAGPRDGVETRQMMWASAPMAVWLRKTLGSLNAAMLNDRNIEVWIHSSNRRDTGWQHLAQALLRRVGRAVNPDGVAQPKNIGRRPAVRAYDFGIEAVFRQTAELPTSGDQSGRLWVPAATFGAGLNGIDAHAAQTGDLHELGDGRLATEVRGRNPRVVPIRAYWTETARRAAQLAHQRHGDGSSTRFIGAADKNAVTRIAASLDFGQGGLSLRRARATWLTAHLLAGTPLVALRIIAGGVSGPTLTELIDVAVDGVDADTAVRQGLGP